MDQAIRTLMRVIIRLVAVGLFITGLILAHEYLYETFDPARYRSPQTFPRAELPSRNKEAWTLLKLKVIENQKPFHY